MRYFRRNDEYEQVEETSIMLIASMLLAGWIEITNLVRSLIHEE